MTNLEFNDKYKDYLELDHYGLDINNTDIIKYLDLKFNELIKLDGFKYSQIKMKFNNCRFYTTIKSDDINYHLIDEVENYITDYFSK